MTMTPERVLGSESVDQNSPAVAETNNVVDPRALSRRRLFRTIYDVAQNSGAPVLETIEDATTQAAPDDSTIEIPIGEVTANENPDLLELSRRYQEALLEAFARIFPLNPGFSAQDIMARYVPDTTLVAQLSREADDREQNEPAKGSVFTRRRVLRILRNSAITAGAVVAAGKLGITFDQLAGLLVWGENDSDDEPEDPNKQPNVYDVTPPEVAATNPSHGTFVFGGLGVKNAKPITEALIEPLSSQGRVFGMNYDNIIGVQIPYLARVISKQITEQGLKEISFYGHSMGGDVSLRVAVEVLRLHPEVKLRNIVLDCTPSGLNAVRNQSKERVTAVNKLRADLNVEYGGPVTRMLIELPNSPNTDFFTFEAYPPYIDISRLIDRIRVVKDEKLNSYAASNRLLLQQIDTIISMNLQKTFAELYELTKNQKVAPVITHFHPRDGSKDKTVDVDQAEQDFRTAASEAGLYFATHLMDGEDMHHADPTALSSVYIEGLRALYLSQAESLRMQIATLNEQKWLGYLAMEERLDEKKRINEQQNLAGIAHNPPG